MHNLICQRLDLFNRMHELAWVRLGKNLRRNIKLHPRTSGSFSVMLLNMPPNLCHNLGHLCKWIKQVCQVSLPIWPRSQQTRFCKTTNKSSALLNHLHNLQHIWTIPITSQQHIVAPQQYHHKANKSTSISNTRSSTPSTRATINPSYHITSIICWHNKVDINSKSTGCNHITRKASKN